MTSLSKESGANRGSITGCFDGDVLNNGTSPSFLAFFDGDVPIFRTSPSLIRSYLRAAAKLTPELSAKYMSDGRHGFRVTVSGKKRCFSTARYKNQSCRILRNHSATSEPEQTANEQTNQQVSRNKQQTSRLICKQTDLISKRTGLQKAKLRQARLQKDQLPEGQTKANQTTKSQTTANQTTKRPITRRPNYGKLHYRAS